MKEKGTLKNLITVIGGNGMYLLSNILLGFLLPMILGVEDYGYYKIYTLYIGYCGLLSFGYADGIILRYSGCEYAQLDKPLFRTYTRFFFAMEGIMTLLVLGISLFLQKEYGVIIAFVGLNLLWNNATLYYQYLSQATSRFREFSLRKTLQAMGIICSLLILLLMGKYFSVNRISYVIMIVIMQGISIGLLAWYVYTYRDITFGKGVALRIAWKDIQGLIRKGIVLTVSFEVAQLILLMDRQLVSMFFAVEVYAKYAFAYNILSCITALITAISTVMFPLLKKMKQEEALGKFDEMLSAVMCLVGICLVGIYPVEWIIGWILPKYVEAMAFLRIVFPALMFTSCVTIVGVTYYKVMDNIKSYLYICFAILVLALLGGGAAILFWDTPIANSIASVVTMVAWFAAAIGYLGKKYCVRWKACFLYGIVLMVAFYGTTFCACGRWIKAMAYIIIYGVATVLLIRNKKR